MSFEPGPHLNVILGPNGAGKSSLILALAIGLGGRLSSLGRATRMEDYVRTGCEEATIRIELLRDR